MTVVRWNPLREINEMRNQIDRLFYDTWRPLLQAAQNDANALALDIYETNEGYTVITNIPGVPSDQINIRIDDNFLTISAEIPAPTVQNEGTRSLLLERPTGVFSRRIQLPQHIDTEHAEATYENGVLTLTLPKTPEAKPRILTVKQANGHKLTNGAKQ